jgi:predicted RNA methylase
MNEPQHNPLSYCPKTPKQDHSFILYRFRALIHIKMFIANQLYQDFIRKKYGERGGAVVEALRYKPEGRGFDSRWCHWNFSLT